MEGEQRRLSAQAFADRNRRPSVDRAHLCGNNSAYSRKNAGEGVVSLAARTVRTLTASKYDKDGKIIVQEYFADVEPVPLGDNPAHAEIFGRPAFDNDKVFRRICESLARNTAWEIVPEEPFSE
jgi:hypothetical protein